MPAKVLHLQRPPLSASRRYQEFAAYAASPTLCYLLFQQPSSRCWLLVGVLSARSSVSAIPHLQSAGPDLLQALRAEAQGKSLVLLDEVGTGTEPVGFCISGFC